MGDLAIRTRSQDLLHQPRLDVVEETAHLRERADERVAAHGLDVLAQTAHLVGIDAEAEIVCVNAGEVGDGVA